MSGPIIVIPSQARATVQVPQQTPAIVSVERGPVGPQGPPGSGGDLTYVFNQAIASALWSITHNLGKHPSVTTVDTAGNENEGAVTYTGLNTLTVTFNAPFSGTAYLN